MENHCGRRGKGAQVRAVQVWKWVLALAAVLSGAVLHLPSL